MKHAADFNKHRIPKTHKHQIQDLSNSRKMVVRGNVMGSGPTEQTQRESGELSRGPSSRQQMEVFIGEWGSI